jgi:hypothetical protein
MDAIPVSFVLPLYTTTTVVGVSSPHPLVTQVAAARQALGTPAVQVESILHYIGVLLTLLHEGGEGAWAGILSSATTFEWTAPTPGERALRPSRLDVEIRLALSLLCSVLGMRGEEAARKFRATEARAIFIQCALAFDILHLFMARTTTSTAQRDEPRARAIIARLFAEQSHYATLAHDKDKDQYAVGLGLAATYWRLSHGELARVSSCAALATGYAHYLLMACASEKARELGEVDSQASDMAQLARLEQLHALATLEGQRAAEIFSKDPAMRDTCTNCSVAAQKQRRQACDARFKWLLILEKKEKEAAQPSVIPTEDASAVFASQIMEDAFGVKPLVVLPDGNVDVVPLAKNELWSRLVRSAQAWLLLQGGRDGLRRALAPLAAPDHRRLANVDVSRQLLVDIAKPGLTLTRRDEVVLALGRMSERLQWLQHESATVLALPGETDELRATIGRLTTLLMKKNSD